MFALVSFLIALTFSHREASYSKEALKDEVTGLPGLPDDYEAKIFSGYMNTHNGSVFYMFLEAQESPETAPLIWWTNGGPGCSGFNGLLEENGPFRPNKDGNLDLNPHAWNKKANMVFVEQPVGVGFSVPSVGVNYTDHGAALDNHAFLSNFFDRFPDLKLRPFYLSSESYGGHYLPTLAQQLLLQPIPNTSFGGFLVGNPLTYLPFRDYGQYFTAWGHQLLPKPLWDDIMNNNCLTFSKNLKQNSKQKIYSRKWRGHPRKNNEICDTLIGQADQIMSPLDPYALDFPVCNTANRAGRQERFFLAKALHKVKKNQGFKGYFPPKYEPCEDSYTEKYMTRPDVQVAIHAIKNKISVRDWSVCSNVVGSKYSDHDVMAPMMPIYSFLVSHPAKIKMMIYSGDDDSVCATAGTQEFLWSMGWDYDTDKYWQEWKTDDNLSGFVTTFKNGFMFKTVHGAGHMVPSTRPAQALNLLHTFLFGNE